MHERIRWLKNHPLWSYPSKLYLDGYGICTVDTFPDHLVDPDGKPYVVVQMGGFLECVDIDPVLVNPLTGFIDEDDSLNTKLVVWLEGGGWYDMRDDPHAPPCVDPWVACHDINLDCSGDTMEEALLRLADLVEEHYGQDGDQLLADGTWRPGVVK